MAYARRRTRSATRSRGGYTRAAPRRASPGRRRSTGRAVRTGAQTLKIVVEQIPATAVTRPGMFTQVPQKPGRTARL